MAKRKKEKAALEERKFTVGLQKLYSFPKKRRANKAITLLKRFVFKHLRLGERDVLLSSKLNQQLWKKGREHVPRKLDIKVIVDKGKANVFLQSEKVHVPKKEEKKKEEKKKTEEEIAAEAEKERKKEEKKAAERAAEAAAIKRGTLK